MQKFGIVARTSLPQFYFFSRVGTTAEAPISNGENCGRFYMGGKFWGRKHASYWTFQAHVTHNIFEIYLLH